MDCVVKSWIAGTISTDLAEMVIDRVATARTVWCALEDKFLGNRETRAPTSTSSSATLSKVIFPSRTFAGASRTWRSSLQILGNPSRITR